MQTPKPRTKKAAVKSFSAQGLNFLSGGASTEQVSVTGAKRESK